MKSTDQEVAAALDAYYVSIGIPIVSAEQRATDLPRKQKYLESFKRDQATPFGKARALKS
jgi:hypothetical protein